MTKKNKKEEETKDENYIRGINFGSIYQFGNGEGDTLGVIYDGCEDRILITNEYSNSVDITNIEGVYFSYCQLENFIKDLQSIKKKIDLIK